MPPKGGGASGEEGEIGMNTFFPKKNRKGGLIEKKAPNYTSLTQLYILYVQEEVTHFV